MPSIGPSRCNGALDFPRLHLGVAPSYLQVPGMKQHSGINHLELEDHIATDGMELNYGKVLTAALPQRTFAAGTHRKSCQATVHRAVLPHNCRQASGQPIDAATECTRSGAREPD